MSLTLSAIFWGIITFSLLIVIHEGAHMFTARMFGVKVHEFFIGLPGPSLSFKRSETRYGVTAIPLGGYVRIAGMEGDVYDPLLEPLLTFITLRQQVTLAEVANHFNLNEDDALKLLKVLVDWDAINEVEESSRYEASYEAKQAENPEALMAQAQENTFLALSPLKRIAVLSAGVLANIICALVVFSVVLSGWGYYEDLGHVNTVNGGPAEAAGVVNNDRVIKINEYKVATFADISSTISKNFHVGDTVSLVVERNKATMTIPVTLDKNLKTGAPFLGVSSELTHVRPTPLKAIGQSFSYVGMTLKALGDFFNPATFKRATSQSASIVGISVMAAKAASTSALDYAWLIAAISLSLGIMNILPLPPLDGGKVVFEIIGALRRKPVPMKVQIATSLAGFGLLFALVIFLTYNDFARLLG